MRRSVGIDYDRYELEGGIAFDYRALAENPPYGIEDVQRIQRLNKVGDTPLLELRRLSQLVRSGAPRRQGRDDPRQGRGGECSRQLQVPAGFDVPGPGRRAGLPRRDRGYVGQLRRGHRLTSGDVRTEGADPAGSLRLDRDEASPRYSKRRAPAKPTGRRSGNSRSVLSSSTSNCSSSKRRATSTPACTPRTPRSGSRRSATRSPSNAQSGSAGSLRRSSQLTAAAETSRAPPAACAAAGPTMPQSSGSAWI